ncbi:MAG TPA: nucleoside triphosphate pyrophosphohydrolase [Herpetosiphonaceae bacterium]
MSVITIIGLGPGAPGQLTVEARELLDGLAALDVRTTVHPTVAALPASLAVRSFDHLYASASEFGAIYATIAATLIERARAGEAVWYAVPGHPLVAEATTRHLLAGAKAAGIPVRIVAGLSFVEPVCTALGLDPLEHGLQLVDALDLVPPAPRAAEGADRAWSELHGAGPYVAPLSPFPLQPARPALLCQVYSAPIASEAKLSLLERYPAQHPVTIVTSAGMADERVAEVPLHELDHQQGFDHLTCVYVPALPIHEDVRGFDAVQWVMEKLAGPFGCPWDREQTHKTLQPFLLEEAHEVLEALNQEDYDAVSEELGDVLLQVVFHAELGRQAGLFDMGDIHAALTNKLIRRHPHIFGDLPVSGSGEVLRNWEAIKAAERAEKGKTDRPSVLDGIPASLPALPTAQTLGRKAAKVGFDWPEVAGVWDKIAEELEELRQAPPEEREGELGDLLFAITNLARWLEIDAETALRQTNAKFRRRFQAIEAGARAQGREVSDLSLDEAEALWQAAKRSG